MAASGTIEGKQLYLGEEPINLIQNNGFVYIDPTYVEPPESWQFRSDANSGSLVFATPGNQITDLGMTYAWSDVHADIKGSGSNKSVLTANISTSGTYNNFSSDGYTESTVVTSTGRLRSTDDTDFEFGSGDFTIECWFNCQTDTTPERYLFSDYQIYNTSNSSLWLKVNPTAIQLLTTISTTEQISNSSTVTWSSGEWKHIALVRNGTNMQIYVNGTSVLSVTRTGALNATASAKYLMGYYAAGVGTGTIQDYRIYKGVAKYTTSFTPPNSLAYFGI